MEATEQLQEVTAVPAVDPVIEEAQARQLAGLNMDPEVYFFWGRP